MRPDLGCQPPDVRVSRQRDRGVWQESGWVSVYGVLCFRVSDQLGEAEGIITAEGAGQYYRGSDVALDFDHVLRVLALAERIAYAEGTDVEIVRAASLLYDVGRAEQGLTGHSYAELGAKRAYYILTDHPLERADRVRWMM